MTTRRDGAVALIVAGIVTMVAGNTFVSVFQRQTVVASPAVTRTTKLSAYFSGLSGGPGDTDVFVIDSGKPGGTMLVMGPRASAGDCDHCRAGSGVVGHQVAP